jgi:hypothetical protein
MGLKDMNEMRMQTPEYAYDYANSGCHEIPNEKITKFEKTTEMSELNMRQYKPKRYIVNDYWKKYPTNLGEQNIHDDEVIRPRKTRNWQIMMNT